MGPDSALKHPSLVRLALLSACRGAAAPATCCRLVLHYPDQISEVNIMNEILKVLRINARESTADIAKMLNRSQEEVENEIGEVCHP